MIFKKQDLKQVMADIFGLDVRNVNEDSSIDTIEGWDSLRHLNLVLALEQKFNVTFTHEETTEILNYNLIRLTLEKHGIKLMESELDRKR